MTFNYRFEIIISLQAIGAGRLIKDILNSKIKDMANPKTLLKEVIKKELLEVLFTEKNSRSIIIFKKHNSLDFFGYSSYLAVSKFPHHHTLGNSE